MDAAAEALNTIAWRDFLWFAWCDADARANFTAATGLVIPNSTEHDLVRIDHCGDEVIEAFIEWATVNHFGLQHAPKRYRDRIAAKTPQTASAAAVR